MIRRILLSTMIRRILLSIGCFGICVWLVVNNVSILGQILFSAMAIYCAYYAFESINKYEKESKKETAQWKT